MKMHEKYLEVLKLVDDYITIKEWATKFVQIYHNEISLEKDKKTIVRNSTKSISALISTEKWGNNISIDTSKKDKRIKYTIIKQKEDIMNIDPKDNKKIAFKVIMDDLKYMDYDYKLPNREDDYNHFENAELSGYKYYIAFQMAIRNKDVIEISKKLDYISEIITNNSISNSLRDWICEIEYWEDIFEEEHPKPTIDSDSKNEYIFIAELPLTKFKEEMDFSIDKKEFTKENYKSAIVLKIIADYLQHKLIKEYCIYKDGYFFINSQGYFNPEEVIDDNSIDKDNYNTNKLEDSIKAFINTLIDRKTNHLKKTADLFFMYDYSKKEEEKRREENNVAVDANDVDYNYYTPVPINQIIKLILTKHHGIEIEKLKVTYTYDECLEKYEELTKYEVSFYTGEKTIKTKIDLMEKFIEEKLYKYILFY
jgi:hypothetical protein